MSVYNNKNIQISSDLQSQLENFVFDLKPNDENNNFNIPIESKKVKLSNNNNNNITNSTEPSFFIDVEQDESLKDKNLKQTETLEYNELDATDQNDKENKPKWIDENEDEEETKISLHQRIE